jgi:hypothetical protein
MHRQFAEVAALAHDLSPDVQLQSSLRARLKTERSRSECVRWAGQTDRQSCGTISIRCWKQNARASFLSENFDASLAAPHRLELSNAPERFAKAENVQPLQPHQVYADQDGGREGMLIHGLVETGTLGGHRPTQSGTATGSQGCSRETDTPLF